MSELQSRKCVACRGDTPKLTEENIEAYLALVDGWEDHDNGEIEKKFEFKNFEEALAFFNAVAAIAIEEDHHPDMSIIDYRVVYLIFTTHAIEGLSDNDFVMAAKSDQIYRTMPHA